MAQTEKSQWSGDRVAALVVGTQHEYQRHQDRVPESEQIRVRFKQHILELVRDRQIQLIAEEAGTDEEVWTTLRAEEAATPVEFAGLFEAKAVVDAPQRTIASDIAEQNRCQYVDIRSPDAIAMSMGERDAAMAKTNADRNTSSVNVLVIVGAAHLAGVSRILKEEYNWDVSSQSFP
ncbi:MAG TPA: hypothetical protein VIH56_00010 [Candidatus Acidoferrales bacterium]